MSQAATLLVPPEVPMESQELCDYIQAHLGTLNTELAHMKTAMQAAAANADVQQRFGLTEQEIAAATQGIAVATAKIDNAARVVNEKLEASSSVVATGAMRGTHRGQDITDPNR